MAPATAKISLKGLAKFMTATPANQRRVLRDFKHPDPEGYAQGRYYRDARRTIVAYQRDEHEPAWLLKWAERLMRQAATAERRSADRLKHNARVLRSYSQHFASRKLGILPGIHLHLSIAGVRVTVNPDLHVVERRREKIIRVECSKDPLDEAAIRIMNQAMFEAALSRGMRVTSAGVLLFDIARGEAHKGARMGSRLRAEIEAACENIATLWPGI